MFSDVTVSPGVPSGVGRDAKLTSLMQALARRRQDRTPTSDVAAAFKEGERAPVAGAEPA